MHTYQGTKYKIENRPPEVNELAKLPNGHIYVVIAVNKAQNRCKLDAPRWYQFGSWKVLKTASPIFEED